MLTIVTCLVKPGSCSHRPNYFCCQWHFIELIGAVHHILKGPLPPNLFGLMLTKCCIDAITVKKLFKKIFLCHYCTCICKRLRGQMLCSLFVNVYRKYYYFLKDNLLRWEDQAMSFQNGVKTVIKMLSVD